VISDSSLEGQPDMPLDKAGKKSREPGRPQKRVNPEDGPLPFLAQALRDLREACGNPAYRTMQARTGVPHQRLAEAARGEQLPAWAVVEGYIKGCEAYYQRKHGDEPPGGTAAELTRWRQLYRDAGGTFPEEQPGRDAAKPTLNPAPAHALARRARSGRTRLLQVISPGRRPGRSSIQIGAAVTSTVLVTGAAVMLGLWPGHARPSPVTGSVTAASDAGTVVAASGHACGNAFSDGFRSPATTMFSDITAVGMLSLDGLSASLMEGIHDGITYRWVEAHPTGRKAGIQLRWSNAPGKWYYCTATLKPGNISKLPDLVATTAVPTVVHGQHVTYQACIWHQQPYTQQCSKLQ
jgi:hypothetical protein